MTMLDEPPASDRLVERLDRCGVTVWLPPLRPATARELRAGLARLLGPARDWETILRTLDVIGGNMVLGVEQHLPRQPYRAWSLQVRGGTWLAAAIADLDAGRGFPATAADVRIERDLAADLARLVPGTILRLSRMRRLVYDGDGVAHGEVARITSVLPGAPLEWRALPGRPLTPEMIDAFLADWRADAA